MLDCGYQILAGPVASETFPSRLNTWSCCTSLWMKVSSKWNCRTVDYSFLSSATAANQSAFPTLRNSVQSHVSVSNCTSFHLCGQRLFPTLMSRSHGCATWKREKNQPNQPTGSPEPCNVVLAYMSWFQLQIHTWCDGNTTVCMGILVCF